MPIMSCLLACVYLYASSLWEKKEIYKLQNHRKQEITPHKHPTVTSVYLLMYTINKVFSGVNMTSKLLRPRHIAKVTRFNIDVKHGHLAVTMETAQSLLVGARRVLVLARS